MIADVDGDFVEMSREDMPTQVPLLVTRNIVPYPGIVTTIFVARHSSLTLVREYEKNKGFIAIVPQLNPEIEIPSRNEMFDLGVYARVIKILELPGGNVSAILQAFGRLSVGDIYSTSPYFMANVAPAPEILDHVGDKEFMAAMEDLRKRTNRYIHINEDIPDEAVYAINNVKNDVMTINYLCTNMPFDFIDRLDLLRESDIKERLFGLMKVTDRELKLQELKQNIREKTRDDLDEQQRNYFIQQQIKNLQAEITDGKQDSEREAILEKMRDKTVPTILLPTLHKELDKLEQLNPQSPDYNVQLTYLQTFASLPWGVYSKDDHNLTRAQRVMDRAHYGMEKVKERILEYIAVLSLRGDLKSPIICLYGPPGVGKTSLGKSIADSLRRKYVRVSLGGLHDEAEIRGHRRTYIGAMPGRIIKGIQKAETSNPVFILDEIDKVTQSVVNGDPASALLEVLDPEQNNAFHDNYLDVDYDLSKVLFIATANDLNTIPRPLLDRMEIIEVSGYITEEKIEIAKRHLIPRQMEATGLKNKGKISFSKSAIEKIIEQYTRESGVRELDKQLAKLMRKLARKVAFEETLPASIKSTELASPDYLGSVRYTRDKYQGNGYAGVVTGLAWTAVGGEILFVESSLVKGKGEKLTLTGNLGDVMKESAMLALQYVHAHATDFEIDEQRFEQWNVHIHVPEGAIPKDGPSAGITMVTSLVSTFTQRKVRKQLAMTGEITLRGKVLPVGGIKEKILAAKRAGITQLILCRENEKDILEISPDYLKGLIFHYVDDIRQVIDLALLPEKVDHPLF